MPPGRRHLRAVFISDVHLGTRDCRANLLLDFLRTVRCDELYLVGDIVDVESMRRSVHWPAAHTEVLRLIFAKAAAGTNVVYIPGNHDDTFRSLCGKAFGNLRIERSVVHVTSAGKRLLVLHGDEFDQVIKCGKVAAMLGLAACHGLLKLNRLVHFVHNVLGRPYWSLAQHVKSRFGHAVRYIGRYRDACLAAAAQAEVDGVVCGHIHQAALLERDGLLYCNDGDWVESCTALIEDQKGTLTLVRWPEAANIETIHKPVRRAA